MLKVKIKKLRENAIIPKRQKLGDAGMDAYISNFKEPIKEILTVPIKQYGFKISEITKTFNEISNIEYMLQPLYRVICGLGFATEIPKGYYAHVVPRSGLAVWDGLTVLNTPGTIDSGYRGEWTAITVNISNKPVRLRIGERICQIIIRKCEEFELVEVNKLNESVRGIGGFGSTGKK